RALPMAVRRAHLYSLDHLLDRHGAFCAPAFHPPAESALVAVALEKRLATHGADAPLRAVDDPRAWSAVLARLAVAGVGWDHAIAGVARGARDAERVAVLQAEWSACPARQLDAVLPPAS